MSQNRVGTLQADRGANVIFIGNRRTSHGLALINNVGGRITGTAQHTGSPYRETNKVHKHTNIGRDGAMNLFECVPPLC